ncbi:MAG: hypothetical protein PUC12_01550 [Clostridiales bacterium]|nr:hypothetical protein [Clostridiales bacterium]
MKVSDGILDEIDVLDLFPNSRTLTSDKWLNDMGYCMVICEKNVKYVMNI